MKISGRVASVHILAAVLVSILAGCAGSPSPAGPPSGPENRLTITGEELHKLVNNPALWKGSDTVDRACVGFWCGSPIWTRRTQVILSAETNAMNVGPNPSDPLGTLIGKLENRGGAKEARYGLTPGPYDFLMYVFPGTGRQGRWQIIRVERKEPYATKVVSEGNQVGCNHPTSVWTGSFARFLSCEHGPPAQGAVGRRPTESGVRTAGINLFSFLALLNHGGRVADDPTWYTCTDGCCVSDAARLY